MYAYKYLHSSARTLIKIAKFVLVHSINVCRTFWSRGAVCKHLFRRLQRICILYNMARMERCGFFP